MHHTINARACSGCGPLRAGAPSSFGFALRTTSQTRDVVGRPVEHETQTAATAVALTLLIACASSTPQWVDTSVGRAIRVSGTPTSVRVDPIYPEKLREERLEGYAAVELVADEIGAVIAIERASKPQRIR